MKIALIAPCKQDQRWKGRKSSFVWPPMGLLTLGALTPQDIDVRLYDEAVDEFDPAGIECDLACISILTANAPRGYEIAGILRNRGIAVIIGGIHASMLPSEAARHGDSVYIGEAEVAWSEVLDDFTKGSGLKPEYGPGSFCSPEDIPVPRRELLKPRSYGVPATIMATRGCPYNCSFCSTTRFMGNRYRLRPVENVVEDIASFSKRWCIFLDDNLFANKRYAKDLMKAIAPHRKLWVAQTSMNASEDPELLSAARKAGCMGVLIGFESLSEANLKDVRKGINKVDSFKKAVDAFHDAGIFVQGSFIFGFDGDDKDIFDRTFEFVHEAGLEGANFSVLTPLPGTDLYKRLDDEGRIFEKDWAMFDKLNVCFEVRNFDKDDLVARVKALYRRTYSLRSIFKRLSLLSRRGIFSRQGLTALAFNLAYRKGVYKRWD
jgi:radical SAM superfamily enzyme YgiQ (UPF0313 family)